MLVKDAMHRRSVTIGAQETLPSAVVMMQELKVKRLPVVLDKKVVGLLTDGEIKRNLPKLSEGLTPWEFAGRAGRIRVREVMRQPVHTVTPEMPLDTAIKTMLDRRIGGMPVVDDEGELLGMLTLTDILRAEVKAPRLQWGAVEQHMTSQVVTVNAEDPASEGAAKLKVSRLRVLPVLDAGVLVGILHETDVSAAIDRAVAAHKDTVLKEQFYLENQTVRDLMRPPTGYLREGMPMHDALKSMVDLNVHGLPIIADDGKLLGVVTVSDVLKTILGVK